MKEEAETSGFIKTKTTDNPQKQNERYLQYIYLTKDQHVPQNYKEVLKIVKRKKINKKMGKKTKTKTKTLNIYFTEEMCLDKNHLKTFPQ